MFFLSSTDDSDVFEFNSGNLFCNTLKDYLRLYTQVGLGEFGEGIELFGGKMVRVDDGVIKNLSNIKEPKIG